MSKCHDDWGLGGIFEAGFWPGSFWARAGRHRRRRQQMFESGEVKFVILRLLREKPRHGYDVMKALEERLGGVYSPSAGTVYPTLQMLEDQGYIRGVETEGRRVYHITPEGERLLDERRDEIEDIFARLRETVRDFAGGAMGDLNSAFAELAARAYKEAFRRGPGHPAIRAVAAILRRAAEDIERAWQTEEGSD